MQRQYSVMYAFLLAITISFFSIGYKHSLQDLSAFDVIVSDLAEPILERPNVTELSYHCCNILFCLVQ
jgi:hypothetical protein